MTSTYYVDLHYNIIANFQYQGTDENAKEVYEYIAEKNNLNDYAYYSESSALINTQKYGTKAAKTYMQENYVKTDKYRRLLSCCPSLLDAADKTANDMKEDKK